MSQREAVTSWVCAHARCKCGGRLAFALRASYQVGVCASWRFGCERDCVLPTLETSAPLHGDDYKLNSLLNYSVSHGALSR